LQKQYDETDIQKLKNDNKNKAITHKIYVETQCGKKPRTATNTINPL